LGSLPWGGHTSVLIIIIIIIMLKSRFQRLFREELERWAAERRGGRPDEDADAKPKARGTIVQLSFQVVQRTGRYVLTRSSGADPEVQIPSI
jgi:hypothetical protein